MDKIMKVNSSLDQIKDKRTAYLFRISAKLQRERSMKEKIFMKQRERSAKLLFKFNNVIENNKNKADALKRKNNDSI